ncbi:hypothetical protein EDB86DRAFT_2827529 [Lactarius hatsudake]|nr:hypothetical protein EDB86DRAFT_2827529 [Lactarius hatsudake]
MAKLYHTGQVALPAIPSFQTGAWNGPIICIPPLSPVVPCHREYHREYGSAVRRWSKTPSRFVHIEALTLSVSWALLGFPTYRTGEYIQEWYSSPTRTHIKIVLDIRSPLSHSASTPPFENFAPKLRSTSLPGHWKILGKKNDSVAVIGVLGPTGLWSDPKICPFLFDGYAFHRYNLFTSLTHNLSLAAQAMAPTNSCQEVHHTLGGSSFAHPIPSPPFRTTRPLHRYSFRRVSFAHQRRFRSRQNSPLVVTSASAVNGPPPPYTPTIDLHPSIIPPTATSTTAADLHQPASPQTQISRHPMSATAIALIVVCTLVGLVLCIVIGRFAYRKRLPSLRWPWRTRREEDSLGFVFVEYDDSTWGTPAKGTWREIPAFEAGPQEREGGEAHARTLASSPLAPKAEAHPVPSVPQPDPEAPPENKTNERDLDSAPQTGGIGPHIATKFGVPFNLVIGNTLGLAMGDGLGLGVLASSELAAVLALHAGTETLDGLAGPGMREHGPPDASGAEETEVSSLSSGLVTCVSSSTEENSGSEDDYELHRVETRSMDFKRGIIVSLGAITDTDGEGDEKPLPRVVISGSSSEMLPSSNRVSGMSEGTIDLGDFPRPPVIRL